MGVLAFSPRTRSALFGAASAALVFVGAQTGYAQTAARPQVADAASQARAQCERKLKGVDTNAVQLACGAIEKSKLKEELNSLKAGLNAELRDAKCVRDLKEAKTSLPRETWVEFWAREREGAQSNPCAALARVPKRSAAIMRATN